MRPDVFVLQLLHVRQSCKSKGPAPTLPREISPASYTGIICAEDKALQWMEPERYHRCGHEWTVDRLVPRHLARRKSIKSRGFWGCPISIKIVFLTVAPSRRRNSDLGTEHQLPGDRGHGGFDVGTACCNADLQSKCE